MQGMDWQHIVHKTYLFADYPIEYVNADHSEKTSLVVTDKENDLIHFFDKQDNRIPLGDDGVIVPQSYADVYHIRAGDMISIVFTTPELKQKTVEMKVASLPEEPGDKHQQIPDQINVTITVMSVVLAFLLTWLSGLMLRRKVNQIHMIESLKSIE